MIKQKQAYEQTPYACLLLFFLFCSIESEKEQTLNLLIYPSSSSAHRGRCGGRADCARCRRCEAH